MPESAGGELVRRPANARPSREKVAPGSRRIDPVFEMLPDAVAGEERGCRNATTRGRRTHAIFELHDPGY